MKKIIVIIGLLLFVVEGFAQKTIVRTVNVNDSGDTMVSVTEEFFDEDMTKMLKKALFRREFEPHWAGFEMGFNGYGKSGFSTAVPQEYSQMKEYVGSSLAYNLNLFDIGRRFGKSNVGILSGLGLTWNNYHFDDENTIIYTENKKLTAIHDTTTSRDYSKSKLNIFWLRVPLMFEWQNGEENFAKAIYVSAGVVGGVKLSSHTKQKFDDKFTGGTAKLKTHDDFYLSAFKADLELHVGLGPIRIFVNYGLTEMFQKDKGPKLYPWTIGLTLVNF